MKRIRIVIEDVQRKKKQRKKREPKHINKYKKLYARGVKIHSTLSQDNNLSDLKGIEARSEYVYNSPLFKEFLKILNTLKAYETRKCFSAVITTVLLFLISGGLCFWYQTPLYYYGLVLILSACLGIILNSPRVSYKKFYNEVYLQICNLCAIEQKERSYYTFKAKDKRFRQNSVGAPVITNSYDISAEKLSANVSRIAIRDMIRQLVNDNGNIKVVNRRTTVFTGYSLKIRPRGQGKHERLGNLLFAAVKEGVFSYNTFIEDKISSKDIVKISEDWGIFNAFDRSWKFYASPKIIENKRVLKELLKKTIELKNNANSFDMYVFDNEIHLYLDVVNGTSNKLNEFICSDSKNINQQGFYTNIKLIYVYALLSRTIYLLSRKNFLGDKFFKTLVR